MSIKILQYYEKPLASNLGTSDDELISNFSSTVVCSYY